MRRPAVVECRWAARHLDRWLDGGRSGPLRPEEVARLLRHLAVCRRCERTAADRLRVDAALARLGEADGPDAVAVARLRAAAAQLGTEPGGPGDRTDAERRRGRLRR